ncbi:hypothetical protein [uncultured Anaerovibrio sp.]|nr:hypothetical protein [uncultured Anaerovibrio sp.]
MLIIPGSLGGAVTQVTVGVILRKNQIGVEEMEKNGENKRFDNNSGI